MAENWTLNLKQFFNDIAGQRTVFDSSHEPNEKKHNQSPKLEKKVIKRLFVHTNLMLGASFLAYVQVIL